MIIANQDLVIQQGSTFNYIVRWETSPIVYVPITNITQAAPAVITATGHGAPNGWRVAITGVKGMTQINAAGSPPYDNDYHWATVVDTNTISLNDVNASTYKAYTSGGYLQYNTPQPLTGYTARMDIVSNIPATTYQLQCMIAGTSGAGMPTPPAVPSTQLMADNSVSWQINSTPLAGNYPAWQPNTAYTVNTVVTLTTGDVIYEALTTANSEIVIDTTGMTITLTLPATKTATYAWTTPGQYDLKLVSPGGVITTILQGNVTLNMEVTP